MSTPANSAANMYGFPTPINKQLLPIRANRDPANSDKYPVGQGWVNQVSFSIFQLGGYSGGNPQWIALGGGTSALSTLTGDTGTATPSAGNIQLAGGTGISTVASGAVVTITATGAGFEYTTVTADTTMAINSGYVTNKAGTPCVMTLPAIAAFGSAFRVVGRGATGWSIGQAAGQSIHMNSVTSTVGVGGSLASTAQYNSVTLLCTVANTEFTVIDSEGVLTVT